MSGFKVGLASEILNARHSPTALVRANYLTAVASRVDSFWVDDHLNSLLPRAIATPQYLGAAKLIPKVDAYLEPWTMLGHLAARNRLGRLRLGVGVTDAGRRNPAVTAQAATTLHLLTRGRAILGIGPGKREGNQPYGMDWTKPVARFEEAMATIRAVGFRRRTRLPRLAILSAAQRRVRPAALPREMARNLDRGPRSADAESRRPLRPVITNSMTAGVMDIGSRPASDAAARTTSRRCSYSHGRWKKAGSQASA